MKAALPLEAKGSFHRGNQERDGSESAQHKPLADDPSWTIIDSNSASNRSTVQTQQQLMPSQGPAAVRRHLSASSPKGGLSEGDDEYFVQVGEEGSPPDERSSVVSISPPSMKSNASKGLWPSARGDQDQSERKVSEGAMADANAENPISAPFDSTASGEVSPHGRQMAVANSEPSYSAPAGDVEVQLHTPSRAAATP